MSIQKYDQTIDYIEANITLEKDALLYTAEGVLGIRGRKAGEFFSYIEPENRTILRYIRDRKLYCALEEFINGQTAAFVAEKYGISDSSRFSSDVNAMLGKYPKVLRAENYSIPKVQHLIDIVGMGKPIHTYQSSLAEEEKENYVREMQRLIDENFSLKEKLTQINLKEMRKEMERTNAPLNRAMTKEEYLQFLKVEDCRVMYGFDVDQILRLYRESLISNKSLESLCDDALYSFRFEYEQGETETDAIEELQYQLTYEMDSAEAYNYFYGDDSPDELPVDPYAVEEFYEYDEIPDDINPEDRMENEVIERVLEEERTERELARFDDERYIEIVTRAQEKLFEKDNKKPKENEDEIPF